MFMFFRSSSAVSVSQKGNVWWSCCCLVCISSSEHNDTQLRSDGSEKSEMWWMITSEEIEQRIRVEVPTSFPSFLTKNAPRSILVCQANPSSCPASSYHGAHPRRCLLMKWLGPGSNRQKKRSASWEFVVITPWLRAYSESLKFPALAAHSWFHSWKKGKEMKWYSLISW